ncbi:MAG: DMT family transporter [Ruegeria sp.]
MPSFQLARSDAARERLGISMALLSAILIAMAPNAAKIAYQEGANPLAVVVLRHVVGAVFVALILTVRSQWPKNGWPTFRKSAAAGMAQVVAAFGLLGSVAYIDVSLAALIFYLHPFLISVVESFRGNLRLTPLRLICILGATAGLTLVLGVSLEFLNPIGVGLSFVGMASATIWVLLGARLSQEVGPFPAGFYMTVWSIIYLLFLAFAGPYLGVNGHMEFSSSTLGWIAILGAGATTTLGLILFFVGAVIIGAGRAALLSLSEPVFAIFLAIILVHEWLTAWQWVGVAVVVGCLVRFETADQKMSSTK